MGFPLLGPRLLRLSVEMICVLIATSRYLSKGFVQGMAKCVFYLVKPGES